MGGKDSRKEPFEVFVISYSEHLNMSARPRRMLATACFFFFNFNSLVKSKLKSFKKCYRSLSTKMSTTILISKGLIIIICGIKEKPLQRRELEPNSWRIWLAALRSHR